MLLQAAAAGDVCKMAWQRDSTKHSPVARHIHLFSISPYGKRRAIVQANGIVYEGAALGQGFYGDWRRVFGWLSRHLLLVGDREYQFPEIGVRIEKGEASLRPSIDTRNRWCFPEVSGQPAGLYPCH